MRQIHVFNLISSVLITYNIQCWKLTAIDGTFLKDWFILTLLLCIRIDANGHNYWHGMWCRARVLMRESIFLNISKMHLLKSLNFTIISDCGKEHLPTDWVSGPHVAWGHCCVCLKENFGKGFFDPSLFPFFWIIQKQGFPILWTLLSFIQLQNIAVISISKVGWLGTLLENRMETNYPILSNP